MSGPASDTSQRILDIAEELAQKRGFNGFSYADIAERLTVTKASLHYHFRSKADLGCALIERYRDAFADSLRAIERDVDGAPSKLRRYVALYDVVMRQDRMCLCGMLAAEYATLPEPMQARLRGFFDANERWLARVLGGGRRAGELAFSESPRARAARLTSVLEGAMLVARVYGDGERFNSAARNALADLVTPAPASRAARRGGRRIA
ncbi:MAG TPA: TetR/AcrR family transcriptional regulator [Candidatus Baltobacteraceae bacterium]|nr:TetR/AcrR family transcriptional regulator [Candidatus Baltobacteraceae bacterium]